jgi:hypothetical protein
MRASPTGEALAAMRTRLRTALLAAGLGVALTVTSVAAAPVAIYRNEMDTGAARSQMRPVRTGACTRGGSAKALKIEVGKRTDECQFRTPVVGRDLEIIATGRLLSGTPKIIRNRIFIAVNLRVGADGMYQLAVFPRIDKYILRRQNPGEPGFDVLATDRAQRIQGIDKANRIRLRAFNLTNTRDPDDVRLVVGINGKVFERVTDRRGGPLKARASTVSVGATPRSAVGAIASFDDLVVRVPSPF